LSANGQSRDWQAYQILVLAHLKSTLFLITIMDKFHFYVNIFFLTVFQECPIKTIV